MTPEEVARLDAFCAAYTRRLARSVIDWGMLEELLATSHDPEYFQELIDLAIEELQAYRAFPFWPASRA